MARFSRGASGRSGRLLKRSRNASDTASLSSWGSEANVLSDGEEVLELDGPKKHRSSGNTASAQHSGSSSDDDSAQSSLLDLTRGKRPKCFSRNAVLARQNRLKKKKYVEDLESELQTLRKENSKLKVSLNGYSKDVELVRKENVYLRNVLSNSKEISQLIRTINVNCGLPVTSSVSSCCAFNNSESSVQFSTSSPQVVVQCANPASSHPCVDSCIPSANPGCDDNLAARTVKRDYPIAADDVSLSLSAPNDDDDLEILFGTKAVPLDMDLNLNEAACEDSEYLGFGPNALGDWLDGEEPSSHIGVCLHVANQKGPILYSLEGLQFYLPIAEAIAKRLPWAGRKEPGLSYG